MTPEDIHTLKQIMVTALKEYPIHNKPSEKTQECLNELSKADQAQDIRLISMEKDLIAMKEANKNEHASIIQCLQEIKQSADRTNDKIDRLGGKFAGKWTEKVLIFIGTAVGLAVIGALLSLIIKSQP